MIRSLPRLRAEDFRQEVLSYARTRGASRPLGTCGPFCNPAVRTQALRQGLAVAERLFPGNTPVRRHVERFFTLLAQAAQEGDLPRALRGDEVLALVHENLALLAYQTEQSDRALLS